MQVPEFWGVGNRVHVEDRHSADVKVPVYYGEDFRVRNRSVVQVFEYWGVGTRFRVRVRIVSGSKYLSIWGKVLGIVLGLGFG